MTFQDWLKEQREIESKATEGTWTRSTVHHYDQTFTYIETEATGEIVIETASGINPKNVRFICESRNNYRNMLDALEIAVAALSHEDLAIKEIKQKLGVE